MNGLFTVLFLLSVVSLVAGLIKPSWFNKLFKGNANRKNTALTFGIAIIVFLILMGTTSPKTNTSSQSPVAVTDNSKLVVATPPAASKKTTTTTATPQEPPRDSNGLIHQLKITASAQSRSIAFTSEENYTNCSDSLTVITVDGNQQPVFTTYKDNYGSINLFAGDHHSIAYGSLTDTAGDTLSADIISGKFGGNAAGNWGLTCDQGQYSLVIKTIQ